MTPVTVPPRSRLSAVSPRSAAPDVTWPAYARRGPGIGMVHFGPGAFHRAHQAYYVDELLSFDPHWAISAIALRGTQVPEALTAQDGLYTIAELSEPPRYRVIGAIREAIAARIYPQAVLARLANPKVRIVTMTVTENGYCLDANGDLDTARPEIAHDLAHPAAPTSLIGWLVEGLRLRRRAGLAPFTMISCDNLSNNGARLRHAVLQFARDRDPDLAHWIEGEARFPNTMVDSITPASDEALKARVAAKIGAIDQAAVQREPFVQWVIEDAGDGPDWAHAGVTISNDVAGYEQAKLRILNGAHSTLAYLGLLRKRQTTRDAMNDAVLARFVRELVTQDIAPNLTPPAGLDLGAYIESVLTRIANPAITHHLGQIAWDGSQKLPYRLFATIQSARKNGRAIDRLAIPIAAWMRFVRVRAWEGIELIDPLAARLTEIGQAATGSGAHDVMLFKDVLPALDGTFTAALANAYDMIGDGGQLPGDGW